MNSSLHAQGTAESGAAPQARSRLPVAARLVGGGLLAAAAVWVAGCGGKDAPTAPVAQSVAAASASPASAPASRAAAAAQPAPKPPKAPVHQSAPRSEKPAPAKVAAPPPCANCGVVESVREVQVKGQGTGLGAVAGAVAGGVLGHQVGGGDGKKAMTVLGAIGGGLAGNEVEKRVRAETKYEVSVRMDDRSLRTLTVAQAPQPGARVAVEGDSLRAIGPGH